MKLFGKTIVRTAAVAVGLCLAAASCGSDGEKKETKMTKAAQEHAAMRASLKDSAALYKQRTESLLPKMEELQKEFETLNLQFEIDNRADYVEIYRVAKGWKGYDTMSGTGILARLLENGETEVVVSSAAGKFSSVALSGGGQSVATQPVKDNSGLNYTVGNVTRVTFIGADAKALCNFADAHRNDALTLTFRGASTSSIKLSKSQTDMLALFGRVATVNHDLDSVNRCYMTAFNKMTLYEDEVRKDSAAAVSAGKVN